MLRSRSMFSLVVGVAVILLLAAGARGPARAAQIQAGDEIIIPADQVIADDVYLFGETITINGTIKGDVVAMGARITLNGAIEGDALLTGQVVLVNGAVGDDARLAGQIVILGADARIADEAAIAGQSLEAQAGSRVGGDFLLAGYQGLLAGTVAANVQMAVVACELRGAVGGNVYADVTTQGSSDNSLQLFIAMLQTTTPVTAIKPGLTVAESARITGTLEYIANAAGTVAPGAKLGPVHYTPPAPEPPDATPTLLSILLNYFRRLVALLLVGILLIRIAPAWITSLVDFVQAKPVYTLTRGGWLGWAW